MVDPIFIALPISIIVTFVLAFILKPDLDSNHLDKCFNGMEYKKAKTTK
jgi:hypothetical protein